MNIIRVSIQETGTMLLSAIVIFLVGAGLLILLAVCKLVLFWKTVVSYCFPQRTGT